MPCGTKIQRVVASDSAVANGEHLVNLVNRVRVAAVARSGSFEHHGFERARAPAARQHAVLQDLVGLHDPAGRVRRDEHDGDLGRERC